MRLESFVTKKKFKQDTDELQETLTKDIIQDSTRITQKAIKEVSK